MAVTFDGQQVGLANAQDEVAKVYGARGCGKNLFAEGSASDSSSLVEATSRLKELLAAK